LSQDGGYRQAIYQTERGVVWLGVIKVCSYLLFARIVI